MKTVFRNIHLYLSLAAGTIIFCSCLTGTVLVFEEEIEHALHHNRYYAEPAGTRLPVSQLVFNAIKEVPKAEPASVKVYAEANKTVEIGLITPEKKAKAGNKENCTMLKINIDKLTSQIIKIKNIRIKTVLKYAVRNRKTVVSGQISLFSLIRTPEK